MDSPRRRRARYRAPGWRGGASRVLVPEHRHELGDARHGALRAGAAIVLLDVRLTEHRRHAAERRPLVIFQGERDLG